MKKIFFLSLLALFLFTSEAIAGKRYWISTTTSTWNTTANWSTTSTGSGGSTVPGSNDTVYFTSSRTGQCNLDANASVKRWEMASGCGTFTQSTYNITVGTTGAVLSGGAFTGGSGSITFSGVCTISGTAFTSTSGLFSTNSNFSYNSGSFTHNSGRFKFTGPCTITGTGTFQFNKVEFACASAGTYAVSGVAMIIDDTLLISGNAGATITGSISAKGDIVVTNTSNAGGGAGTITINGTGNQTLSGGTVNVVNRLPNVTISKSTGTLSLANTIAVVGNWTYTTGTLSAGSSMVHFITTKTISGTHTLNDVRLSVNAVFTVSNTVTVNGTLTYGNGTTGSIRINTGTINVHGNIDLKTPVAGGGGTATIVINGTTNQTVTGNATEGYSALPNLTINKSTGTLTLDSTITVAGNWTYTAGHIVSATATVCFWDTKTITGSDTLTAISFNGSATAAFTISSGTTLTVSGLLSLNGSVQLAMNTGTIQAQGNIVLNNTYNGNTAGGSALLLINGTGSQTMTGNITRGTSRLPNVRINKSGGALSLIQFITIQGNFTYTAGTVNAGSSTIHFVGTKTIAGSVALNNISFGAPNNFTYTISTGTVITAKGSLEMSGASNITIDTGSIHVRGDIIITNTGTGGGGSATITLDSTASQTLTGSGTAGQGRLPNVVIDKSSGTLTLASTISVAGNWTYVGAGSVAAGTSNVVFYDTKNLDGQGTSGSTMRFYRVQVAGGTRTLTGDLYCRDNLVFVSGTTLSAGTYDITVGGNWNGQGTWIHGNDTVTFVGSSFNRIQGPGGGTVSYAHVAFARRAGSVTCVNPVIIDSSLVLRLGRIKTTSTNYLLFGNNAKCIVDNDDSAYVHGPVQKLGNDAFTFPLGDTTLHDSIAYHPLAMTAPAHDTDMFEARYYAVGQTLGSTLVDTLVSVSNCEYWTIEKQKGASNVTVKVYWNQNSCGVNNYDDLRLAGWLNSGSKWIDLGVSNLNPGFPTGNLSTGTAVNFGTQAAWSIVIGQRPNFSPYATLKRKLDAGYYQCSNGKLMFRFQDEYNDPDAKLSFRIYNDQYGLMTSDQLISSGNVPDVYYGSNYYLLNVLDCNVVPNGNVLNGFFILEVINEKGERWYLRFKHTTSLNPNCESTEPTE